MRILSNLGVKLGGARGSAPLWVLVFLCVGFLCTAPMGSRAAAGEPLPPPQGPVVLTVTGAISVTNVGDTAQFDMAMLQALPKAGFSTATLWTEGVPSFQGVALSDLLARLSVTSGTLQATALNDYSVDIPVTDAVAGGPILAYAMNDTPLSVRDKGPLWVIYPFDKGAEYSTEVIYARSIWQLAKIT
ncbi:MAG: hypothetical protein EBU97_00725, partial [Rhodobacteraceae bacterium]|nr:hypothetical protein [Paracoccaceae bacterium]